jgi:hypothetical protein
LTKEESIESLFVDTVKIGQKHYIIVFPKQKHGKKRLSIFPSPVGMSLTKLSLSENNLIIPGQGKFG